MEDASSSARFADLISPLAAETDSRGWGVQRAVGKVRPVAHSGCRDRFSGLRCALSRSYGGPSIPQTKRPAKVNKRYQGQNPACYRKPSSAVAGVGAAHYRRPRPKSVLITGLIGSVTDALKGSSPAGNPGPKSGPAARPPEAAACLPARTPAARSQQGRLLLQ